MTLKDHALVHILFISTQDPYCLPSKASSLVVQVQVTVYYIWSGYM